MAFSYGFYDSLNGDRRYKAADFGELVGSLLTDGIFENIGQKMFVTAGSGMNINVGSGKAWFDNTWSVNDSVMVITVPQSDITRPRYDAVVLEVNTELTVRENKIKIVSGTPATSPVKPTLTNTAKVHQHPLAYIYVAAAATAITASNIEIVVGQSACPFVTGVLQKTDITGLYNQWNADFTTWFNNLKSQLTSNVVTNLQSQIDTLKTQVVSAATAAEVNAGKITTIINQITNMVDVGSVFSVGYGYNKTVSGALPCTGGSYSPTAYANLFGQIGYTYGGSGTFSDVTFTYPITLYTYQVAQDFTTGYIYTIATTTQSGGKGSKYLCKFDSNLSLISYYTIPEFTSEPSANTQANFVAVGAGVIAIRVGYSKSITCYTLNDGQSYNGSYNYYIKGAACRTGVVVMNINTGTTYGSYVYIASNGTTRSGQVATNVSSMQIQGTTGDAIFFSCQNSNTSPIIYYVGSIVGGVTYKKTVSKMRNLGGAFFYSNKYYLLPDDLSTLYCITNATTLAETSSTLRHLYNDEKALVSYDRGTSIITTAYQYVFKTWVDHAILQLNPSTYLIQVYQYPGSSSTYYYQLMIVNVESSSISLLPVPASKMYTGSSTEYAIFSKLGNYYYIGANRIAVSSLMFMVPDNTTTANLYLPTHIYQDYIKY